MTPIAWKMPSLITRRLNVFSDPFVSGGAIAPSKTTVRTMMPMLMSANVLAFASYTSPVSISIPNP
jgi:hypothetical protein